MADFVGLQSEMGIRGIYEGSPNYREMLDFYESKGFVLSAFVPNNEGHFPDLVEIDCIMYNKAFIYPEQHDEGVRHGPASA
jgi:hypothetical protein